MLQLAIAAINVFGTLGCTGEEFWSLCLGLFVVAMLIFISVALNGGGGPASGAYSQYIGAKYWYDPGVYANGFKGICSVFVTAAFAFAGTELVGLCRLGDSQPTQHDVQRNQEHLLAYNITYNIILLFIGLNLPPNDEYLLLSSQGTAITSLVVRIRTFPVSVA